jgi:hypothetical protein
MDDDVFHEFTHLRTTTFDDFNFTPLLFYRRRVYFIYLSCGFTHYRCASDGTHHDMRPPGASFGGKSWHGVARMLYATAAAAAYGAALCMPLTRYGARMAYAHALCGSIVNFLY